MLDAMQCQNSYLGFLPVLKGGNYTKLEQRASQIPPGIAANGKQRSGVALSGKNWGNGDEMSFGHRW